MLRRRCNVCGDPVVDGDRDLCAECSAFAEKYGTTP